MNKTSLISEITKFLNLFLLFLGIFITLITFYFFYKDYINNIQFLENQTLNYYKNIITKLNRNVILKYKFEYKILYTKKRNTIKNRIFLAYSILQNFYFNYRDKLSIDELKKRSLLTLTLLKFDNGKSYYSIFTSKGKIIYAPYINSLEPNLFIKNIIKNIVKGENGFYIVQWDYPYNLTINKNFSGITKTSIVYGVCFDKFNWVIITGFFLEDLINNLNKKFLNEIRELEIAKNLGLVIFDNNNDLLYSSKKCKKNFINKLKNKYSKEFSIIYCKKFHYTVLKDEIPLTHWKVYTYFINEKIQSSFIDTKRKLIINLFFQISITILIFLLCFLLFYKYFKNFQKILKSQFKIIIDFIKKVPLTYKKIDLELLKFKELENIGKYSNEMVDTIKKLNNELKIEKEFFDKVLNSLPYGVGVLTPELDIKFVNNYVYSHMGYDSSIIGKNFKELIPKNFNMEKFNLPEIVKKIITSKENLYIEEFKMYKRNGEEIFTNLAIAPIVDKEKERVVEIVFVFYDITESLKLKREILKLNRAIENAPILIVITDTNCKIEYVNPFFENITGYTLDEVKGKSPKILATKHNYKHYPEILGKLSKGEKWIGEFLNKKKNGELYWEQALLSPVFDKNGKIVNFVGVKEDITERKKFLEELKRAKEEAEKANIAKSEFLANMSHEIRTPMNAIIGFIDIMLETELNGLQRQYLEIVKESTQHLLKILNDILDFSKFESGRMQFENRAFNIIKLIKNIYFMFSKKIAEKNLKMKVDIDENIPEIVIGDEVRITQILTNLLSNAIKFSEKGEIKVNASLKETDNEYVTLLFCVSDEGVGIPEDKINKIFEKFTQADASVTRKFGGTGLGLAIIKKIVEYYKGKIWVESEVGKGSKFYFTLKLKIGDVKDLKPKKIAKKEGYFIEKFEILVAEDNVTNQILIKQVLNNLGLKVDIADNGINTLKKLSEKNYDLILMDWHMPEMDGVEAVDILRKIENGEDVKHEKVSPEIIEKLKNRKFKVIALTAAALTEEKELLLKKGFDDYVSKPISKDELVNILSKFLGFVTTSEDESLNLNGVKELLGDDEDLIKEIVSSFKETFEESLNNFDKYSKEKNFSEIYKTAHTLKSAASNLRFNDIATLSKEIENLSKNNDIERIVEVVNKLKEIYKSKFESFSL